MHLPYYQVANEILDVTSIDVAADVGCSPGDAYMAISKVLRWGLERCKEHAPPSAQDTLEGPTAARKIAMVAGIQCDPDAFVTACASARYAVLEVVPNGVRFRGLDRYDAAWRKNHKLNALAWDAAPERAVSGRKAGVKRAESGGETGRQTQIQTQMQKETTTTSEDSAGLVSAAGAIRAPAAVLEGALPCRRDEASPGAALRTPPPPPEPQGMAVEPPDTPVDAWTGHDFWRSCQHLRQLGGFIPEKPPNPARLGSWWSACLMTPGVTATAMQRGFEEYGQDKFWEAKGFPFAGFMSQWAKYTKPEVSDGAAA